MDKSGPKKKKDTRKFDVIVLAAGKGTRMKSPLPKVLHRAAGWTLLHWVADAARRAKAERLVFVLGHGRQAVETEIHSWPRAAWAPIRTEIAYQAEQKGTGHAVSVGFAGLHAEAQQNPILILSGDTPLLTQSTLENLMDCHESSGAVLTVGAMHSSCPTGYGRLVGSAGKLERIVEEKEATAEEQRITLVNGGIYVANPDFLSAFLPALKPSARTQEFYFTDMVALARSHQKIVGYLELPASELDGVNDLVQLADAANDLRRRRADSLLREGVIVEDPRHVFIDQDSVIEPGATIEAHAHIRGNCRIATGAHIECGVRLENVEVHAGARIKAYSCLEDCTVGEGASVGPMAHIRPGTRLASGVKIGNFVELKKTHIGKNSKVSHLSYLGDATVGEEVNVGCGFITCNYDGFQKHPTQIGDRVFVGSDVQVIAPISIGNDAYIASGTTVTKDVPATGDLVIARSRQENKTGYALRLKNMKQTAKPSPGAKRKD